MTEIKTRLKSLSVPLAAQKNILMSKSYRHYFHWKDDFALNKRQQNRQQTRKLCAFEAACSCAQPKILSIGQKFD